MQKQRQARYLAAEPDRRRAVGGRVGRIVQLLDGHTRHSSVQQDANVVFAPDGPATPIGRTALAVLEGAPCAAIHPAAELARSASAELVVLHVATSAEPPAERGSLTPPLYVDQPQHEWPAGRVSSWSGSGACAR